jgi:hypothetical protein
MRYGIALACVLSTLALTDCAGAPRGGMLPASPASANALASSRPVRAKLGLRLTIPKPARHGAHYVSPATKSIVVKKGTTNVGTFETSAGSSGCKLLDGTTVCQFVVAIAEGPNQTFSVSAYDAAEGAGQILSSGSVTQSIVAGYNPILVTLSGAIASVTVALQNPNAPAGTAATVPITVMAKDADGNVIIGPGNYASPITLTNSDASGIAKLSATSVTGPSSNVSLIYNGKSIGSATIGAAVAGLSQANITAGAFVPAPTVIADYAMPLAPGNKPLEPTSIAAGLDGNMYVGVCCGTQTGIVQLTPSGQTTYYQAATAPSTNLPLTQLNGLSAASNGAIWYVGSGPGEIGYITPAGAATNFVLTGGTLCAGATGWRIVPAADGGLWASIGCTTDTQIAHVTTGGTIVTYAVPGLQYVNGITVGEDKNVYVGGNDTSTDEPAVAQAIVSGSTIASTSIVDVPGAGSSNSITAVIAGTNGDLWVTNDACTTSVISRVHLATPFTSSVVSSYKTPNACADSAYGVALPDGSIWIANGNFPFVTRVTPGVYPAAPALLDVPLQSAVYGDEWDVAIGTDGYMYVANYDDTSALSGDVAKLAY